MITAFGIIFCLTVGGSFLVVLMMAIQRIFNNKLPKTWVYYLWLVVLIRFLLPIPSPWNTNLINFMSTMNQPAFDSFQKELNKPTIANSEQTGYIDTDDSETSPSENPQLTKPFWYIQQLQQNKQSQTIIIYILGAIWLAAAVITFLYATARYLMFNRSLRKTSRKILDPEMLQLYKETGNELNIKSLPVLYVSNAINSPMQAGLIFSSLYLPENSVERQHQDLRYFLLHELVHYRRHDVLYKWVVQLCVCLHWFNPFAYVMKRELNTLCELSCDACVLQTLESRERTDYGNMLLQAIETAAIAKRMPLHGVSWGNEKKIVKDRFKHIMDYKNHKKSLWLLLVALTLFLGICGAAGGPVAAANASTVKGDKAIKWTEPALEALVREKLGKPNGVIMQSELDHIWGIELFGNSHIFFNADGGLMMSVGVENYHTGGPESRITNPSHIDLHLQDSEGNTLKDGTYWVESKAYTRGTISSLTDFANFRNLHFLYVNKHNLLDLAGLSSLENLTELFLDDDNIQKISALSELTQIDSLSLEANRISDLSPIEGLTQLRALALRDNQISDLKPIASLSNMERLRVSFNPIDSLEDIREFEHLWGLFLDNTYVDDISILTNMKSLASLSLGSLDADSIDLAPLASVPSLRYLTLSPNRAKLINLSSLYELKELVYLKIRGDGQNTGVSDAEIDLLKKQLPACLIN